MSDFNSDSCLVAKLSYYLELDQAHQELLIELEKTERTIAAGREVHAGGDRMRHLYVVKSGWLYEYTNLPDGGRHVVRIYHPGDIVGLPTVAFRCHTVNLRAANEACLCPFEKHDLDKIFVRAPRITALLFTLSSREQVILVDILRAASRMKPRARLAFLLLDIINRLRTTNADMTNRFALPLTQSDLGDAVGLTNVTVSRTLSDMERDGMIQRSNGYMEFNDEEALKELCDYHNRHAQMDTDWFPTARAL